MNENKKQLQDRLRTLAQKKGVAPAYQRELIQREIDNTRKLLKETYGEDTKAKKMVFPFVVLGGVLTALYLWVSGKRGPNEQKTISSLDL